MRGPSGPAISGGSLRGQHLLVPPGLSTRPTRALVRQALFNMLGERIGGAQVLDLYAGSGALGLEALSRGAARATFVERDARALSALRSNISICRLREDQAEVVAVDVARWQVPHGRCYDIVLADPPYELLHPLPDALRDALAPDAALVLESPRARIAPRALLGLSLLRERAHGVCKLAVYGRGE